MVQQPWSLMWSIPWTASLWFSMMTRWNDARMVLGISGRRRSITFGNWMPLLMITTSNLQFHLNVHKLFVGATTKVHLPSLSGYIYIYIYYIYIYIEVSSDVFHELR